MGVAKLTDQNTIVPESRYARVERERRYLLRDLPEGMTRADPHLQITDNYITGTPALLPTGEVLFGGCDSYIHVLSLADGKELRQIESEALQLLAKGILGE